MEISTNITENPSTGVIYDNKRHPLMDKKVELYEFDMDLMDDSFSKFYDCILVYNQRYMTQRIVT